MNIYYFDTKLYISFIRAIQQYVKTFNCITHTIHKCNIKPLNYNS